MSKDSDWVLEDLLEELASSGFQQDKEGEKLHTTRELSQRLGWTIRRVRRGLHKLIASGEPITARQVRRISSLTGGWHWSWGYMLGKEGEGEPD